MHSPSDGPPTEDRAGTEASQELRDACAVLMNRTDCKIYHQFDAECLYAEGGHAEFIYIGTECPEN
jgi:hypothetical protein